MLTFCRETFCYFIIYDGLQIEVGCKLKTVQVQAWTLRKSDNFKLLPRIWWALAHQENIFTCKILLASSIGKNDRGTAWKWKVYSFHYFHETTLPVHRVHHVCSCGCLQPQNIQVQMKIKASLTAIKADRNAFVLPVHIWLVYWSVNITT